VIGLVVAALLAVDGGAPDAPLVVLEVDHGDLIVREPNPDGGTTDLLVPRAVAEGCYLPTESCIRDGKKEARKTAEISNWNTADLKWVAVAFSAGVVVGAGVTAAAILTSGRK
jgi:hypothetical protein